MPLWRDRFIWQGLGLAIGLPLGIVVVFIIAVGQKVSGRTDTQYALWLVGAWLALTYVLLTVLYGGSYAAGFIIDSAGITNYTQARQARTNKVINTLLILLAPLGTAAGAGFLAQQRQVAQIRWEDVFQVIYYPEQCTIMVNGGFASKIALFCTPENYIQVEEAVRNRLLKQKAGR